MRIKIDGNYKPAKKYMKKISDSNWEETDLWVNTPTGYHMLVPPNVVLLYAENNFDGFLADGTNETANLLDRYVRLGEDKFNNIGIDSHSGTEHGLSGEITTSTRGHQKVAYTGWSFGDQRRYTGTSSHKHTIESHEHTKLGYNRPRYYSFIPTMFNDKIRAGAVFLSLEDLTNLDKFVTNFIIDLELIITNYYQHYLLKLGKDCFPAGDDPLVVDDTVEYTHNHGTVIMNTSSASPAYGIATNAGLDYRYGSISSHTHTANHSMQSRPTIPKHRIYNMYQLQDKDMYFDELPSGVICLCTTDYIPVGWKRYECDPSNVGLAHEKDEQDVIGQYNGSDTHSHSVSVTTGQSSSSGTWGSNASNQYSVDVHSHTFIDTHAIPVSNIPLSINFYGIEKI